MELQVNADDREGGGSQGGEEPLVERAKRGRSPLPAVGLSQGGRKRRQRSVSGQGLVTLSGLALSHI